MPSSPFPTWYSPATVFEGLVVYSRVVNVAEEMAKKASLLNVISGEEPTSSLRILAQRLHCREPLNFALVNVVLRQVEQIDVCPFESLGSSLTLFSQKNADNLGDTHNLGFLQSIWNWVDIHSGTQGLPRVQAIHILSEALLKLLDEGLSKLEARDATRTAGFDASRRLPLHMFVQAPEILVCRLRWVVVKPVTRVWLKELGDRGDTGLGRHRVKSDEKGDGIERRVVDTNG
jgi:hypothetical protein